MNDKQLENKVRQDIANVKKELDTLAGDSAARLGRFGEDISQATGKAKKELNTMLENGVSQMNNEFENLSDDTKARITGTVASVKKNVGHGLSQYNAKAQQAVDKIPGGLSEKAVKYPWVAISIALTVGFLVGSLLKPTHRPYYL